MWACRCGVGNRSHLEFAEWLDTTGELICPHWPGENCAFHDLLYDPKVGEEF